MPLRLVDYQFRDWLRLRPITHAMKTRRYQRLDQRFLEEGTEAHIVAPICQSLTNQQVVTTIAFNDFAAIELQIKLLRQNIPHVVHLIADNSSRSECSSQIASICNHFSVPYVRVPYNPWTGKNPSRSHGFAMNWVWRHLLRESLPRQFGFIDHDLFPTKPTNPFEDLNGQPCYGDKRWAGKRWFLWAGYCFFDFELVRNLPLDFGLDWFAGLDTGGANWDVLYQTIEPAKLRDRNIRQIPVWESVDTKDAYFEWRDDWIHEVGLDVRKDLQTQKRKVLFDLVSQSVNL